jgi:ATP-dependent Lhr-like helicase
MNEPYDLLSTKVQKWIFKQGWSDLREIQKKSIRPILSGDKDVLISASTAAGKTEAFFLPACSAVGSSSVGFSILYISPLKALINDQFRRLEELADILELQVTPWHGDSSQALKKRARKSPAGIILITPESLESLLIRHPGWVKHAFKNLSYIAIDEFHAFIGTERGIHLLSLLNRLEHLVDRYNSPIPRVALSATLGELDKVPLALRPNKSLPCVTITTSNSLATIQLQVKGFTENTNQNSENMQESIEHTICEQLFSLCRGDSHLIFANSRRKTESLAARLSDLSDEECVPNEFFPHHGSLAKHLREDLEKRLQKGNKPTTAICTMTLELGIDIGKVKSVVQVNAPHTVSSLRQRLGRSGRRGTPSILRMFITEKQLISESGVADRLRLELVQSIAMIRLLIASKWFEPADTSFYHFSTLLHQVLALVAQWGGVRADQIHKILCEDGPFQQVSVEQFMILLRSMGKGGLITQLSSSELVLGHEGEKLVNHYTFFAVFQSPEEYRIINGSKVLGTIPVDSLILPEQHIIFAGKRWKVLEVDSVKKVVSVEITRGGEPPLFGGSGMSVHDVVRQEMFKILSEGDYRIEIDGGKKIDFIDTEAKVLFDEAEKFFTAANLSTKEMIQFNTSTYIIPWLGDRVINTLVVLLIKHGYKVGAYAGVIEVEDTTVDELRILLTGINKTGALCEVELSKYVPERHLDKFDKLLPENLELEGYGRRSFNVSGLQEWLRRFG